VAVIVGVGVGGSGVLVDVSVGVGDAASVGGTSVGTSGGVAVETSGRKSAVRVWSGVGAAPLPPGARGKLQPARIIPSKRMGVRTRAVRLFMDASCNLDEISGKKVAIITPERTG
jgi:hypothetical protein